MTPEERQMLTDLANKVAQTPAPPIDAEAEEFIRTHIGSRPDALYLMTQTVLIQNMALEHAKQQIQQLQQGQAPAATGSSFLGSQQPARPVPPNPSQASYSAPPTYQTVPVSGAGGPNSSGAGSFLKGAAQTAAGVAAGALAFEGIRSLFGGIGHMGGFGGGGFFGGGGIGGYAPAEETVINNYYDSPEQGVSDSDADDRDDNSQDDNSQFDDTDYQDSSDDSDFSDDSSGDDFLA
jgi:hypothetical protein